MSDERDVAVGEISGRDVMIGELSGRMGSLEVQVNSLRTSVDQGFGKLHSRIDELYAAENQRKGVINFVKTLLSGGAIATVAEAARSFFGGHHNP